MKYTLKIPTNILKEYEKTFGVSEFSIERLNKMIDDNCNNNDEELDIFSASLLICQVLKTNKTLTTKQCLSLLYSSDEFSISSVSAKKGMTEDDLIDSITEFLGLNYE